MKTSYETIYDRFLNKVEDYEFVQIIQKDEDFFEDSMYRILRGAIPHFMYKKKPFTFDDENKQFSRALDEYEQEILASFMTYEYLHSKTLRDELILQNLGSRDMRQWSPANLLSTIKEVQAKIHDDATVLMNVHYFYDEV